MIYENHIKYVLFDKQHHKDENEFMARLNKQNNKPYEIISFVLKLNDATTFQKKIDYFVKDKIDNILIYDYYSLYNIFTPKGPAFNTNGFEIINNDDYEQIY